MTSVPVYDALGTSHDVTLTWSKSTTAPNTWSLSIAQAGSTTSLGSVDVAFGSDGNPAAPQGTIGSVTATSGSVTGSTFSTGGKATVGLTADFGQGPQSISLGLGTWGGTDGVTQFARTDYNLINVSQNGVKPGASAACP